MHWHAAILMSGVRCVAVTQQTDGRSDHNKVVKSCACLSAGWSPYLSTIACCIPSLAQGFHFQHKKRKQLLQYVSTGLYFHTIPKSLMSWYIEKSYQPGSSGISSYSTHTVPVTAKSIVRNPIIRFLVSHSFHHELQRCWICQYSSHVL
jgi:hypothetical protein